MLRLLDRDPHGHRLHDLLSRFREQELVLGENLRRHQAELESVQHAAARHRVDLSDVQRPLLQRCTELQLECDALATELVHVRMAVAGVAEELAEHDRQRFARERRAELQPTG
ncbi:MAG: hypothetical protein JNK15_18470 [Planctomycetes bacterium]|nr:hypothetical protein [Planctomycetota bacterium]